MSSSLPAKLGRVALAAAPPLLAFCLALRPIENFDIGFILRIGERVANSGIPVTDPFSFPGEGKPWALEQWLGPLLFWKAYAAGGLTGLIVFKALICAAFVSLAYFAARIASGSEVAASFAALLCAAAGAPRFDARPNVLSTLGISVTVWALYRARAGSLRPALLLPLLYAVWAHVHPGYLAGVILAGTFAGATLLPPASRRQGALLLAVTAGCALAAVLSLAVFHPLHLESLSRSLHIFFSPVERANIAEYAPLGASYAVNAPILALLLVPPLCWLLLRRDLPLPVMATWLVFAVAEIRVGRMLAEASVVLAPAFAQATMQALAALRASGKIRSAARLAWLPPLAALAGAGAHFADPDQRGFSWPEALYPVGCYRFIEAHDLPPRMFNDLWFGGSFIFHFDGRRKTFIDGRSFYSDEFFTGDYLPIRNAAPGWQQIVKKWGIEWFLLMPGRFVALHQALRKSGYKIAYLDPYCSVYVR
jgi:hypothetical protein